MNVAGPASGPARDGTRPTVVLVHGLGGNPGTWDRVAPLLAGVCDVRVPDLPGFGAAPAFAGRPITVAGWAGALRAVLPASPAVLVGHSLGAMVAQLLAADAPAAVASLVLVCGFVDGRPRATELSARAESARLAGRTAYAEACMALAAENARPYLGGVRAPTLVVAGEDDPVSPPDTGRQLAGEIPGARLVVVPGASHQLPMERPEALARFIREHAGV